jgi:hypothetical protein
VSADVELRLSAYFARTAATSTLDQAAVVTPDMVQRALKVAAAVCDGTIPESEIPEAIRRLRETGSIQKG